MYNKKTPEILLEFILQKALKEGYDVVDIEIKGSRNFFMEIVLDKKNGITIEECGNFNKKIISWADKNNIFSRSYTIDVCSPGIDRELKSDSAFLWGRGKRVEIRLREPVDGKNVIEGTLVKKNDDGDIIVEIGGNEICIREENVNKTKLKPKI
ncbi:MAG: hypothetical protein KJ983_03590 [Candidatus Omnitrophica bacterium]|nr:hypothetical protein [Candidatus Omnitrophota bacterium]